jgi:hypothetical protein
MNARSYCRLAALLFAIIAVLQFIRAVGGWQVVVSGTTSVGKLDCLRGYRWTCVDRFRRITPGLSGERTDRLAQMRQDDWKACSMGGDPWAMFRGSPAHHLTSICPEALTLHLQLCKRGRISFR